MITVSSNWLSLKSKGLDRVSKSIQKVNPTRNYVPASARKVKTSQYVGLDCEMVEGVSVEHMLARVSIVDFEGRVLYDAYVKPREEVKDFRTHITGITKEILKRRGESFKIVRDKVVELLKDKIVVGHAVHHDFEALDIPQPSAGCLRDTCVFPALRPPNRKQTPSLRLLAEYWLDKTVQAGSHSSIEDARTAMFLFKRFREDWEASLQ